MRSLPERIEIELSNTCNLTCGYCPRRFLPSAGGFIDIDLFKKIIDEMGVFPDTIVVLHRRGESLLHPRFNELMSYVKGKFNEIQIATNATCMDKQKAESLADTVHFVSFSLDTPFRYEKTRGGNYQQVAQNIDYFLKINRGRVKTQVSMVKTDDVTDKEIEEFKQVWKAKVDRVRIYSEHSANGKFGSLKSPRGKRQACVMPSYELLVYFDGKVGRCNHDWAGAPMGDLNKHSIGDIWHSTCYQELRQQHESLLITDATCKECDSWYPVKGNQGTGEVIE